MRIVLARKYDVSGSWLLSVHEKGSLYASNRMHENEQGQDSLPDLIPKGSSRGTHLPPLANKERVHQQDGVSCPVLGSAGGREGATQLYCAFHRRPQRDCPETSGWAQADGEENYWETLQPFFLQILMVLPISNQSRLSTACRALFHAGKSTFELCKSCLVCVPPSSINLQGNTF